MGKDYNRQWALTECERKELKLYEAQCRCLTKLSKLWIGPKPKENFVCDNRISIKICWYIHLPIEIACCPDNLQWISDKDNNRKSIRCSKDIGELLQEYVKWRALHPDYDEQLQNKKKKIVEKYPLIDYINIF